MSGVAYGMMLVFARDTQQKFVMAWVLLFLSYEHIDIEFNANKFGGGYDLNVRTYTMLLVCKLSSLAFCYKDGGEKDHRKLTPE